MIIDNYNEKFYLIYQPIVNLKEDGEVGCQEYEVLLRSSESQQFPAQEYFDVLADETESAHFMDWFQEKLVEKLAASDQVTYSINFHAEQWNYPSSFDFLEQLSPFANQIIIEFTEHIPRGKTRLDFCTIMARVKKMGYRIAVDDFKNGINGIQMLLDVVEHIDRIKFSVTDLWRNEESINFDILSGFSKEHQIQLVVERIESCSVARKLLSLGVSLQQGFLFGSDHLCERFKEKGAHLCGLATDHPAI